MGEEFSINTDSIPDSEINKFIRDKSQESFSNEKLATLNNSGKKLATLMFGENNVENYNELVGNTAELCSTDKPGLYDKCNYHFNLNLKIA